MRILLLLLAATCLSVSSLPVHAAVKLPVGDWTATASAGRMLPGQMSIKPDGYFILAPAGHTPVRGTWTNKGNVITLLLPDYGTSVLKWNIRAKRLTLTYANGVSEQFQQSPPQ
ncbi:MAG: hypothetical protein Q7S87_08910 [Agitococcus sp.]|nr:hypothetical protein [Agitococcus sp.]MDO9177020.1 hypothetical protein [Agitococcus sp.]